ncbi:hypothetical protein FDECE_1370 [Fusarium decemcellulare]|nr:hypothetical protein FDECE_1370 [Fusarium decemcellulare]
MLEHERDVSEAMLAELGRHPRCIHFPTEEDLSHYPQYRLASDTSEALRVERVHGRGSPSTTTRDRRGRSAQSSLHRAFIKQEDSDSMDVDEAEHVEDSEEGEEDEDSEGDDREGDDSEEDLWTSCLGGVKRREAGVSPFPL